MKRILRPAALILALLLLLSLTACDGTKRKQAFVNHDLRDVRDFSFGTVEEGEGVHSSGTVFVQKEEKGNGANASVA